MMERSVKRYRQGAAMVRLPYPQRSLAKQRRELLAMQRKVERMLADLIPEESVPAHELGFHRAFEGQLRLSARQIDEALRRLANAGSV
jgi:hypothetical protein